MVKVLMFGWEFPPFTKGGLGTACYGLTKSLSKQGIKILFVMPKLPKDAKAEFVELISEEDEFNSIELIETKTLLHQYITSEEYSKKLQILKTNSNSSKDNWQIYGSNLYEEVLRYAQLARTIARKHDFDVIHAHDWLTYLAGIEAKKVSKKPLIIHVHATEFDRSPYPNPFVYDIEKKGIQFADAIICVSNLTKKIIIEKYGADPKKVFVVHNGIDYEEKSISVEKNEHLVLFLGRITYQKGPEYFIEVAKKVLQFEPNTKFLVVGEGDMLPWLIHKVASEGLGGKILFTGFLRGKELEKAYALADVYVMPSRSEPFGLTPLEALLCGTPAIISKQSGVSEVLTHALKVDFWDVDEMTNKIVALLRYKSLHNTLKNHGREEIKTLSWDKAAEKVKCIYFCIMKTYF